MPRPVFTASLFSSLPVRATADASISFVSSEGFALYCARRELLRLPLSSFALPQLALASFTDAPPKLPTAAPLHSIACDEASGRVWGLHADGWLLIWDGKNGELLHSTRLLPLDGAAAMPTSLCLLTADAPSGLFLVNLSWCDGRVAFHEPLSADAVDTVSVTPPVEPPGPPKPTFTPTFTPTSPPGNTLATSLLYLQNLELLLVCFEGVSSVFGYDTAGGGVAAQLGGHTGGPPILCSISGLKNTAGEGSPQGLNNTVGEGSSPGSHNTGGEGSSSGLNNTAGEGSSPPELVTTGGRDGTVRVWRLRRDFVYSPAFGGRAGVRAECVAALPGHAGRVTCLGCLSGAGLLVSGGEDCSVRMWDAKAVPHLLTGPEGGIARRWDAAAHSLAAQQEGACTGGQDCSVRMWGAIPAPDLRTVPEGAVGKWDGGAAAHPLTASREGAYTGGKDCSVRMWDVRAAPLLSVPEGACADGDDCSVRMWDASAVHHLLNAPPEGAHVDDHMRCLGFPFAQLPFSHCTLLGLSFPPMPLHVARPELPCPLYAPRPVSSCFPAHYRV